MVDSSRVVVIGGGIAGVMVALECHALGRAVVLLEQSDGIGTGGATLVNQCRNHVGYHYPRAPETVAEVRVSHQAFYERFADCFETDVKNHYAVAREGSKTSPEAFIEFCKRENLPYTLQWPDDIPLDREKVAISLRVPEGIFNPVRLGKRLAEMLHAAGIEYHLSTKVRGIEHSATGVTVIADTLRGEARFEGAGAINCTYGAINTIHASLGAPMDTYHYQLCEVMLIRLPWKSRDAFAIMDGPFFGLVPFGKTGLFVAYHVKHVVLETVVDQLPNFSRSIREYRDAAFTKQRFQTFIEASRPYLPGLERAEYVDSMFTTRVFIPEGHERAHRPTILLRPAPRVWSCFTGKICTTVVVSKKLAAEVDAYLREQAA